MHKTQRTYTKEFKQEAIQLVQSSQKSQAQIARDLGIAESTLQHWCQLVREQGEQAFVGSGHQMPQEEEIRHLKRENELLRQERDILKRAMPMLGTTANEQEYTWGERSQRQDGVIALYAHERG